MNTAQRPFFGRQAELEVVARAVRAGSCGEPQVVLVEGDPGIGKTAFVRRCTSCVDGVVVLAAAGDESEQGLDLGVVCQLVSGARATGRWPAPGDVIADPARASSFGVGAELLEMLAALQVAGPVLVVLDDAHWIDETSAGALLFVLRRLRAERVCVLIAARSDAVVSDASPWGRLLGDRERVGYVRLGGLEVEDVRLLAGAAGHKRVTVAMARRLREHTAGHPLHLHALLSELPTSALEAPDGALPAPRSLAATVLARLAGLGADAQRLVVAAAVAGDHCPIGLLGAAGALDDPLPALDQAVAAEFLVAERGVPVRVTFTHPLLRAAVYDDLSLTRRRALHLAYAELTEADAALAHRVAASLGDDDRLCAELSQAAEAKIAAGDLGTGADLLLAASRVAGDRQVSESALLQAVGCVGGTGDVRRAHALREAVVACGDSPHRSFALAILTASSLRLSQAVAELRAVCERSDFREHPELLGPVTSTLAIVYAHAGRGREAIACARRALRADELPPTVEGTARQALALGLAMAGRPRDGVGVLSEVSASRLVPEPLEAEMLATRGRLKGWSGELVGAQQELTTVIGWAQAGHTLHSLPNTYTSLAEVEYRLGIWDEGFEHAQLAVSLAHDSGQVWELAAAHAVASLFCAGRGDWHHATEHVQSAHRATDTTALAFSGRYAWTASAHLAAQRSDWDAVLDALRSLRATASALAGPLTTMTAELEAEALIVCGRPDEASRVLARFAAAGAGDETAAANDAGLWRVRGLLEHTRGRPEQAREAFAAGRQAVAEHPSTLAEATLALTYGQFLRKTGARREAAARLRAAHAGFEQLRARPLLDRCDAELAACGLRTQSTIPDDHGLTPREQVIARLVASGRSNREVGQELYLSTKTVEYHLANIFLKVGIRSRHQLAARLAGTVPARARQPVGS